MKRGVVQYADLAIDLDGDCVPAHCFRAEALQAMAQQRPSAKAASKAAKACARGLAACDRCVALEGLSGYRARLESMRSALPPPPPKKASTKSRAQPPQKLENVVVDLSSEDKPRKVAVTTADVRSAGGAPLRQSDWNKKDTSVSGAERAPSAYRIDGATSRHLHAIDAYATQVGGARRLVVGRGAIRGAAQRGDHKGRPGPARALLGFEAGQGRRASCGVPAQGQVPVRLFLF